MFHKSGTDHQDCLEKINQQKAQKKAGRSSSTVSMPGSTEDSGGKFNLQLTAHLTSYGT